VGDWAGFDSLLSHLRQAICQFPDKRKGKNTSYEVEDFALAAFSVFFTQSPSFLSHQQYLEDTQGKNNARTLFGIQKIPGVTQIRDVLDGVEPALLKPAFTSTLAELQQTPEFGRFQYSGLKNSLLVALDGTGYFYSDKICCDRCQVIQKTSGKKEVTGYQHTCLIPAIVRPDEPVVLPLFPEFITPQDGDAKQDCEYKAAVRWLGGDHPELSKYDVTILGDDLYAKQGICQAILDNEWDFILTCKDPSHKYLKEEVELRSQAGEATSHQRTYWNGKHKLTETYRWVLGVPLRENQGLEVNWVEVVIADETGKESYRNCFVTSHFIDHENVVALIGAARARWKIENEGNNTLKNHGYHLEHNFGHGKKCLSQTLLAMNLLAFLFHSLLEVLDQPYKEVRQLLGRRKKFFDHVEALTTYFVYDKFDLLIAFMLERLRATRSSKKPRS